MASNNVNLTDFVGSQHNTGDSLVISGGNIIWAGTTINSVTYDSSESKIHFKHDDTDVCDPLDASSFIGESLPPYNRYNMNDLLKVVNDSGNIKLTWGQPTGYWTQRVGCENEQHIVTQEDIDTGYFDITINFTANNTTDVQDYPAFVALSWTIQTPSGSISSRISSIDFAIGVDGGSFKNLFTDSAPATQTHKDWGMTNSWILQTQYNRIRCRCNLSSNAAVGDDFRFYIGGIVTQVR